MMPACKSCGASIRWAKTLSGSSIPLNMTPDPKGNIMVLDNRAVIITGVDPTKLPAGEPRFTSHFKDCPYASHHRRK
jgi:hypothetical protein